MDDRQRALPHELGQVRSALAQVVLRFQAKMATVGQEHWCRVPRQKLLDLLHHLHQGCGAVASSLFLPEGNIEEALEQLENAFIALEQMMWLGSLAQPDGDMGEKEFDLQLRDHLLAPLQQSAVEWAMHDDVLQKKILLQEHPDLDFVQSSGDPASALDDFRARIADRLDPDGEDGQRWDVLFGIHPDQHRLQFLHNLPQERDRGDSSNQPWDSFPTSSHGAPGGDDFIPGGMARLPDELEMACLIDEPLPLSALVACLGLPSHAVLASAKGKVRWTSGAPLARQADGLEEDDPSILSAPVDEVALARALKDYQRQAETEPEERLSPLAPLSDPGPLELAVRKRLFTFLPDAKEIIFQVVAGSTVSAASPLRPTSTDPADLKAVEALVQTWLWHDLLCTFFVHGLGPGAPGHQLVRSGQTSSSDWKRRADQADLSALANFLGQSLVEVQSVLPVWFDDLRTRIALVIQSGGYGPGLVLPIRAGTARPKGPLGLPAEMLRLDVIETVGRVDLVGRLLAQYLARWRSRPPNPEGAGLYAVHVVASVAESMGNFRAGVSAWQGLLAWSGQVHSWSSVRDLIASVTPAGLPARELRRLLARAGRQVLRPASLGSSVGQGHWDELDAVDALLDPIVMVVRVFLRHPAAFRQRGAGGAGAEIAKKLEGLDLREDVLDRVDRDSFWQMMQRVLAALSAQDILQLPRLLFSLPASMRETPAKPSAPSAAIIPSRRGKRGGALGHKQ